jgi:thioredoxin 1
VRLSPVVEELEKEYRGKVKIVAADVDQSQDTAAGLGIMSIPALVFFKGGKEVGRIVGAQPKQKLKDALKAHLGV